MLELRERERERERERMRSLIKVGAENVVLSRYFTYVITNLTNKGVPTAAILTN